MTRTPDPAFANVDSEMHRRVHPELADALRGPFEVDRHRILASAAFRRLERKTQVFAPALSDHFRTRLTHTLEVAHVARTLARALHAAEDLVEVISLAHDLGHPPFGHAGEAALDEAMRDHGGFNHNAHSLRVVEYLEHPFPAFRGLNLTRATLEGLAAHVTRYDTPSEARGVVEEHPDATPVGSAVRTLLLFPPSLPRADRGGSSPDAIAPPVDPLVREPLVRESLLAPSLEADIASLADRLAYNLHDMEDAIGAGLVTQDSLAGLEVWRHACARLPRGFRGRSLFALRRPVMDAILEDLLLDVVSTTQGKPREASLAPTNVPDREAHRPTPFVRLSPDGERLLSSLEGFLVERVYRHPTVAQTDAEGRDVVRSLFARFLADPTQMPKRFALRVAEQGPHRVICDYIAGMTDRFCTAEHARLVACR